MNKLAVTTFVLATSLTGVAAAKGGFAGPIAPQPGGTINPNPTPAPTTTPDKLDPKTQSTSDQKIIDQMLDTAIGKKFVQAVKSEEPILDELDPGARCGNVLGEKTFNLPALSTDIGDSPVAIGGSGGFKIFADATSMGAEASFGPTLDVFGQMLKPAELKLTATTNNQGKHSVDVKLLAFTYELDTYNVTQSTTPIDYLHWIGWSLPTPISGTMGGSYDCSGVLDKCSIGWSVSPLVATIAGGLAFRLSNAGVEAHALLVAHANSDARVWGNASYTFEDPVFHEKHTVALSATGSGALRFFNGSFMGNAKLVPLSNYWLATADAAVDVPEALGAVVRGEFDPPVIDPLSYDVYSHPSTSFADQWLYKCTFNKAWK